MNLKDIQDNRSWKELGIADKIKLSLAVGLVVASVVLGITAFLILYEIPNSVIGIDGLWLAAACSILGISMYFHNSLISFETKVNERLNKIDKKIDEDDKTVE